MSSIEAGHGLRSVHMTLERDFDIERMEFDSVLDYLLPTILLLMLRIRFLRAALERQALDMAPRLSYCCFCSSTGMLSPSANSPRPST